MNSAPSNDRGRRNGLPALALYVYIGPAIAVGLIFAAYINGVARQPEARNLLQPIAILGFALAEALAIFGLVLFFI